ncbi:MAG: hypothetical protein P0Y65_14915 [Candidatus Devosia phytovorans]|uniref:Uncharacterized protein n=1 Tax=Candidatus Devosia phytovorans TaxID=3121372 RepID=A0AAJ5VRJ9_9HYPH|nr:hypothetical protein [Devosia sp.]WEK03478.1 MAG: hypothetical protein P0Y65_14915 [Devosia sp.]
MDMYSLAVTHIHARPQPAQMSAAAEDRYYASQAALPPLRPGLLGSIAAMASLILWFGTSLT